MKIILFAVPGMGEKCLDALVAEGVRPEFVVPPHQDHFGRKPVIEASHRHDIPVVMFDHSPAQQLFVDRIQALAPDLILVGGFPQLIPESVFSSARLAAINAHPSLLPDYRGANPYYHVIANGEKETGVTLHLLDSGFDTGDVLSQSKLPITARETMGTLVQKLACLAAEQMVHLVKRIDKSGLPESSKQDQTTRCKANRVGAWEIDWRLAVDPIDRRVRALNPYYQTETRINNSRVSILSGVPISRSSSEKPGKIIDIDDRGLYVATGEGVYCITALRYGSEWAGDVAGLVGHGYLQVGSQFI